MREQIEKIYDTYCKIRKLSKEQGELQTWGKEPMIEFAEQVILQLKQADVIKSVCDHDFVSCGTKAVECIKCKKIFRTE